MSARVVTRTVPLWRIRLGRELPRYLLGAASVLGIAASARFVIAPPRPAVSVLRHGGAEPELSAQSFAVQFTRRFLSWSSASPEVGAALDSYVGSALEPDAGLVPPDRGQEHVQWAEAVQVRVPQPGVQVYTVAAETDAQGLRYLAVPVEREQSGALALAGYPAFVGPPANVPARGRARGAAVQDAALGEVVRRALGNYLADSPAELSADLAQAARVSMPAPGLRLLSLLRLEWAPGGGAVVASAKASDGLGALYTLSYEMDVLHRQGRWEIGAIETNPDA